MHLTGEGVHVGLEFLYDGMILVLVSKTKFSLDGCASLRVDASHADICFAVHVGMYDGYERTVRYPLFQLRLVILKSASSVVAQIFGYSHIAHRWKASIL